MHYLCVLNPAAGKGRVAERIPQIQEQIQNAGLATEFFISTYKGSIEHFLLQQSRVPDCIIAVGGDGTLHEVVNGLQGRKALLGLMPLGSGNDLSRMFAVSSSLTDMIAVICAGYTRPIDIGRIEDRYFINGLGIGFDARVAAIMNDTMFLRGFSGYLYGVCRALVENQGYPVRLNVDSRHIEKHVFLISVGNGGYLGGGFFLNPLARYDDGLLDVCIVDFLPRHKVIRYLPKVMKGSHMALQEVEHYQTHRLTVASEHVLPIQCDGETYSFNRKYLTIEVCAGQLDVLCQSDSTTG